MAKRRRRKKTPLEKELAAVEKMAKALHTLTWVTQRKRVMRTVAVLMDVDLRE